MSEYTESIASKIETKHRQLCLARVGLWTLIGKAKESKTEKEATRALDEIVHASVSFDEMNKEFDRLTSYAESVAHEMNLVDSILGRFSGLEKKEE